MQAHTSTSSELITFKPRQNDNIFRIIEQWPNLKNLSGGLNLSHGLNMDGWFHLKLKLYQMFQDLSWR